MATRRDGGNCRMCGMPILPGGGVVMGFTIQGNPEVFCSEECAKKAREQRNKAIGCLFKIVALPMKAMTKLFFNKYCLTLFTCGMSYLLWKGLDKVYNPKPRVKKESGDE